MKTFWICFLGWPFCCFCTACAQSIPIPVSMPGILLQTFNKEFAPAGIHYNAAALGNISGPGFSLLADRRYMMQEQQFFLASLQFPFQTANAGLALIHESSGRWKKNGLAFGLGRRLGTMISTGIQLNAVWEQAHGYSPRFNWSGDAGINFHLGSQLTAGFHVSDPFSFFLSSSSPEKLRKTFFTAGLGYEVGETFSLSAVMRSEKGGGMDIITGFEYRYLNRFFFRAGFAGNYGIYFLGSGIAFRSSRMDLSFSIHPRLGVSSGFLWAVRLKKRTS